MFENELDDVDCAASGGNDSDPISQNWVAAFFRQFNNFYKIQMRSLERWEEIDGTNSQESGNIFQEIDRDDIDVHQPANDSLELFPCSPDSSNEAETVNIADSKHQVPPRDYHGPPWRRIVQPEQEQGGLAFGSSTTHAMVTSGSYSLASYITFMSVLTAYSTSESRRMFTEVNNSTPGDAYCFCNAFVYMIKVYSFSSAVAALCDPGKVFTQSSGNVVMSDNDDNDDGVKN